MCIHLLRFKQKNLIDEKISKLNMQLEVMGVGEFQIFKLFVSRLFVALLPLSYQGKKYLIMKLIFKALVKRFTLIHVIIFGFVERLIILAGNFNILLKQLHQERLENCRRLSEGKGKCICELCFLYDTPVSSESRLIYLKIQRLC